MKKPRLERGPKLNSAIAQPQTMITSGVRQLPMPGAVRNSPAFADMQISRWWCRARRGSRIHYRELIHFHGNPNRQVRENSVCNAALQIEADRFDDLIIPPSGEAGPGMLGMICSI